MILQYLFISTTCFTIFTNCLKGEERGWKINIIFSIKYETSPKMCSSEKFAELKIVQLIVNATGIVIYRSYYLDRPLSKEPQPAAGRCIFNQTARVEGCYEFFANVDHEVAQRLSFFPSFYFLCDREQCVSAWIYEFSFLLVSERGIVARCWNN